MLSKSGVGGGVACDSCGDLNGNGNGNENGNENGNGEAKEVGGDKQGGSAEVRKMRTQSGMAAELFSEVEAQQKRLLAHKLRVDPWKASRSPNAKEAPAVRTRYESPVNACKLLCVYTRVDEAAFVTFIKRQLLRNYTNYPQLKPVYRGGMLLCIS